MWLTCASSHTTATRRTTMGGVNDGGWTLDNTQHSKEGILSMVNDLDGKNDSRCGARHESDYFLREID